MADQPHQRPAVANPSASRAYKVYKELFAGWNAVSRHTKSKRKAKWDPYNTFRSGKAIKEFYSGHKYHRYSLIDHENFAKFAIKRILECHPHDIFETTGDILKQQVFIDLSEDPRAIDDLVKAIRADGQQDVDAEVPRDIVTRASKSDDLEMTQTLSAAAQSFIAASPSSLGPPLIPCTLYLKMTECGHHGRKKSTVWTSPFIPKLDNQDGRKGLLNHQVTAIVWLLSRMFGDLPMLRYKDPVTGELLSKDVPTSPDNRNRTWLKGPKYFGGILADSMGLGKTLVTVALVDLLVTQRLNVLRTEDGASKYRPILLIVPNATVANQWVHEFEQVTDESTLHHIVVSCPGMDESAVQGRVVLLDRENFLQWPDKLSYMWNQDNPQASRVVLITTMESWAVRTVTTLDPSKGGAWTSSFTEEGRSFSLVIVDEAHKVKNHRTKNWRSVYFLERQFTLLITATPCMNTLTDLFGLAKLLWTAPERYLQQKHETWRDIGAMFRKLEDLDHLDDFPQPHDFQLVAGRPALLAKLLCKSGKARTLDIELTRKYLKYFEALAMLKRSPSSHLYADWSKKKPIPLEGLFPEVENYTVDISLGEAYDKEYQRIHVDLLIKYLERLKAWGNIDGSRSKKIKKEDGDEKESIMNSMRLFQIASSSLDVYDLHTIITESGHSTLAPSITEMREKGVDLLCLAQFLVLPTEKKPETHIGWMNIATRNSPVLRYILNYINENILTRKKDEPIRKLLIIEQNLMLAFYYELVLQFLGLNCRCLHAHLSSQERQELVDSFNSKDSNSCQILIQLYTVGFAGTNLHKSCSRVLVASQSHSLPIQWQAIHRVIRVGQEEDVTVHRVKLKNSYHTFRESRQIEKILPELGGRAHGKMNKFLVQLLNHFQYEVHKAWNSPEAQRLRKEMNLLEDEEEEAAGDSVEPHRKMAKLDNTPRTSLHLESRNVRVAETITPEDAKVKLEDKKANVIKDPRRKIENMGSLPAHKFDIKVESNEVKLEDIPDFCTTTPAFTLARAVKRTPVLLKRKRDAIDPKPGDGSGGWFNGDSWRKEADSEEFLMRRMRDEYYQEFLALPNEARCRFSHAKNNLRRLLSYMNEDDEWTEEDLEYPAVLERALELMLRVRLGANDIAMLPFPMIDYSQAPESRRRQLQGLLAGMRHTDQALDRGSTAASTRDLRETLRGVDMKKPLEEIERELEHQVRFGDTEISSARKKAPTTAVLGSSAASPDGDENNGGDEDEDDDLYLFP
ncbi:P-loop containing nucleoside triphosphate hydrolase protein [Nemania sp. NC0429]|nr:P-loop containing nucleoside triphosphate hydrolase protein [Nemania sp. NC0429]